MIAQLDKYHALAAAPPAPPPLALRPPPLALAAPRAAESGTENGAQAVEIPQGDIRMRFSRSVSPATRSPRLGARFVATRRSAVERAAAAACATRGRVAGLAASACRAAERHTLTPINDEPGGEALQVGASTGSRA